MDEWRVILNPPATAADVHGPFATYEAALAHIKAQAVPAACGLWLIRHAAPGYAQQPMALPTVSVTV